MVKIITSKSPFEGSSSSNFRTCLGPRRHSRRSHVTTNISKHFSCLWHCYWGSSPFSETPTSIIGLSDRRFDLEAQINLAHMYTARICGRRRLFVFLTLGFWFKKTKSRQCCVRIVDRRMSQKSTSRCRTLDSGYSTLAIQEARRRIRPCPFSSFSPGP